MEEEPKSSNLGAPNTSLNITDNPALKNDRWKPRRHKHLENHETEYSISDRMREAHIQSR